ncbi:lipocalin-like domain-containing protein [Flavobacterium ajazii]|uniref:lipocalin family protein n=1 Tax=Flavobacterium ajazii TaxID=2692318 RepID=UPI0013D80CF2|nr:lipocalin family protein [Flavobacterium ajazii]
MRKIISLIAFVAITLSSCSSDDNENKEQSPTIEISELVGTWNHVRSELSGEEVDSQDIVKFTSGGSVTFTYIGFGTNGKDVTESGSYSISGNTIIIQWYGSGSSSRFTLQELTNKKLKWKTTADGEVLIETFSK